MTAKLPRTPASLYQAPYISNSSAWDVRYVSISSGSRAFPLKVYGTLTDSAIRHHYAKRGKAWDGRFVIWIGPSGEQVPELARREQGA